MKYLKYHLYALLLIVALGSCESNKEQAAPIPFEQMKSILLDMHIAEYKSQGIGDKEGTFLKNEDSLAYYYASIINKYQLDTVVFRNAIDWYMMHPIIFDSVYKAIVVELDTAADTFKNIPKPENNGDPKKMQNVLENLKTTHEPPPFNDDETD